MISAMIADRLMPGLYTEKLRLREDAEGAQGHQTAVHIHAHMANMAKATLAVGTEKIRGVIEHPG